MNKLYFFRVTERGIAERLKKELDEVCPLMCPTRIVFDTDEIPVSNSVYVKEGIKSIILVDRGNRVPDWMEMLKA